MCFKGVEELLGWRAEIRGMIDVMCCKKVGIVMGRGTKVVKGS